MFHQDLGMRIDLVLASDAVAGRVQAAWVDRQARKGKGPSDHAPVIVDLDEAPGRGHRAGRPAALRAGHQARREEAAAGALALSRWRSRSRDGCTRFGSPGIFG